MPAYFTPELFRFLARLKRNNNRDWFLAHKDEYETHVRQPALTFITDFAAPLYAITPHLVADVRPSRGSLFRIYRDTRFSGDKRPYKTHIAMRFSHRGKDVHSPGFYLHLEAGGCFAASGLWHPEPPTLLRVRSAMVSRPKEWRAVRKLLNWDDASKLSRPPRGFPSRPRIRGGPQASRSRDGSGVPGRTRIQSKVHGDFCGRLPQDVSLGSVSQQCAWLGVLADGVAMEW